MTTGEGGAIASIHPELLEKAKRFSRQGLVRNPIEFKFTDEGPWHQEVHEFGLNYRLPDILCALGISQLKYLESFKAARAVNFSTYKDLLGELSEIQLPTQRSYVDPTWHLYPIQVKASNRKIIFEALRSNGIGVQVNYLPANWHPVFNDGEIKIGAFPNAEAFYAQQISLPMHVNLSDLDKDFITKTLIMICNSLIS